MDNGASEQMICSKESLCKSQRAKGLTIVKLPNGNDLTIDSSGSVKLMSHIELHDALFVPNFTCNLISVSKITQQFNCLVNFFPTFYVI